MAWRQDLLARVRASFSCLRGGSLMLADQAAESYWQQFLRQTSPRRDERLLAAETANDLTRKVEVWVDSFELLSREAAVGALVALANAAPSGRALAFLGAGLIEDWLQGASLEDAHLLFTATGGSPNLREALRTVYFADFSEDARELFTSLHTVTD